MSARPKSDRLGGRPATLGWACKLLERMSVEEWDDYMAGDLSAEELRCRHLRDVQSELGGGAE